jgi:hypothetical protein
MDKPTIDNNGNISWPNKELAPLPENFGATTAAESQAIRNSLDQQRDTAPARQTLDDYFSDAAVTARVKRLQQSQPKSEEQI